MAQFEEAASAHVQKLNFPYGNSDCAECQTVVTPENFPYSFLLNPDLLYTKGRRKRNKKQEQKTISLVTPVA